MKSELSPCDARLKNRLTELRKHIFSVFISFLRNNSYLCTRQSLTSMMFKEIMINAKVPPVHVADEAVGVDLSSTGSDDM